MESAINIILENLVLPILLALSTAVALLIKKAVNDGTFIMSFKHFIRGPLTREASLSNDYDIDRELYYFQAKYNFRHVAILEIKNGDYVNGRSFNRVTMTYEPFNCNYSLIKSFIAIPAAHYMETLRKYIDTDEPIIIDRDDIKKDTGTLGLSTMSRNKIAMYVGIKISKQDEKWPRAIIAHL